MNSDGKISETKEMSLDGMGWEWMGWDEMGWDGIK